MAEQVWGTFNTPCAGRSCSHCKSDALNVISSFQSILERDRLSANRKPVTQCPSLLYWHMSPCYYSSDAAFLCNETVSIAFHMSAKDVCLYESTANLETTGCTEGPARVKNNDLQTDSYRDNLLTQDISTLASSALGRMS